MRTIIVAFIEAYQVTISPDHGLFRGRFPHGFCPYYPSCSEYTRLSVLRFGVLRGSWLGAARILRCNPFVQPRVDKIPNS